MHKAEVFSVEDSGFYTSSDGRTYGSTVKVTLVRGDEYVTCDGILIWEEEEDILDEVFDEWQGYAEEGEEGYTFWVDN